MIEWNIHINHKIHLMCVLSLFILLVFEAMAVCSILCAHHEPIPRAYFFLRKETVTQNEKFETKKNAFLAHAFSLLCNTIKYTLKKSFDSILINCIASVLCLYL